VPLLENAPNSPPTMIETATLCYDSTFAFGVRPHADSSTLLRIRIGPNPGKDDRITVEGPSGNTLFDRRIAADGEWHDLEIPTVQPGTHTLSVFDQKNTFTLQTPSHLPFVCSGDNTCPGLSPRTYFFVPWGTRSVAVYCPDISLPLILRDPEGRTVTVERNEQKNNLFVIDIPPGMDVRCWSYERFKSWVPLRLLNVPSVFAFSEEGMMVPKEVRTPSVKGRH
jgi:hypothetical protein